VVAPPPPPQIIFDTPSPGAQVGSPVVITGRTTRYPSNGQLSYRVRDASGGVIGSGRFGVDRAADRGASFNASLIFAEPRGGGTITVDIYDQNPANGAILVSASINLFVAPPS